MRGKIVRIRLCLLLLLIAGVLHPHAPAWAEDGAPLFIDWTGDQTAYGETVAALIRDAQLVTGQTTGKKNGRKAAKTLWPVLCRTDGGAFPFDAWEPACVVAGPSDCYTLFFPAEALAEAAAKALALLPEIQYAEPDSAVEACAAGDVSFYSWGAESMDYAPYLAYSDPIVSGSALVAVVDSGVYPHPLYADRVLESGYDYVDADEDATDDPFGHGTNVAGIIADCTQGFPVLFYPIRVLDANGGGSVSNTVNAIREAIEKQVDVINLSLSTKKVSAALDAAVREALDAGITVVAAAGNASVDTSQVSPANLADAGVIIVGAAEADGSRSSYTNYGSTVDVYAYGTNVLCCSNSGDYTAATGTSIAAPHIAALASLLNLTHSGITPQEIETRIRLSTDLTAEVNIPGLTRMIPASPGFSLTLLKLDLQDEITLPAAIRPATAMEPLLYESSDDAVVTVTDGALVPVGAGQAQITACCLGLPDTVFTVEVTGEDCAVLALPQSLKSIGEDAFFGDSAARHIVLPEGCETVAPGAFDNCAGLRTVELPASVTSLEKGVAFSDAVVIFPESEQIETYLLSQNIPYIMRDVS